MARKKAAVDNGSLNDTTQVSDTTEPMAFSPEVPDISDAIEEMETEIKEDKQVEIPDKFKGKTIEDVVQSYGELEKKLGTQSQELGELRKWAREYVQREILPTKQVEKKDVPEKIDLDTLIEKPEVLNDYIESVVAKRLEKVEEKLNQTEAKFGFAEFEKRHPDYREIGHSPEFVEWVKKNPRRMEKFALADSGNVNVADELLSDFKEIRELVGQKQETNEQEQKASRKSTMRRMSGESGTAPVTTKKIYRAIDLINLQRTNPERYAQMGDEILEAYREGRVK